jgi:hypothetical protein
MRNELAEEIAMTPRWKRRPEGSNWGDFGPDDQRGRLNLIDARKVRQGIAQVTEGKTLCLSLPLDYPGGNVLNPRRHPPRKFATLRSGRANYNCALSHEHAAHTDVISDDAVLLHLQYSTQWDALCHYGSEWDAQGDGSISMIYYNGYRACEHIVANENADAREPWMRYEGVEARALGIENRAQACVQGHAVMIDLHAHFGRERRYVGYDDLMRVMEQDKVIVEAGDMLCFHTGFAQALLEMRRQPDAKVLEGVCAGLDGRDAKLLQWITDSNVAVLIADNYAVEQYPPRPGSGRHAMLPLHEHCLFKLGIHLGEIWYLSELAAWLREHGRNRFLLTAPPLNLPGAVGSPATPVATV